MKSAYFLKGKVNNIFRIECLKCLKSMIISDITPDDSDAVERAIQDFQSDHRFCIRKRPTQLEISEADDRADLELINFNNSDPTTGDKEVIVYETT